jgi:hypothetical protein
MAIAGPQARAQQIGVRRAQSVHDGCERIGFGRTLWFRAGHVCLLSQNFIHKNIDCVSGAADGSAMRERKSNFTE